MYNLLEVDIPQTPNHLSKRGQKQQLCSSKPGRREIDPKGRFKDAGTTQGRSKEGANDTTVYKCTAQEDRTKRPE